MAKSQNGWTAYRNASNFTPFRWITGRVNKSASVIALFDDFCVWFNREIEPITKAHSWGWNYREIRGASTSLSNHASGTAIDLNAPKHPLGASGTFTNSQASKIRAKLKEYGGVIRWGGDYSGRKDEMHFEINDSAAAVKKAADKLAGGASKPTTSTSSSSKPAKKTTTPSATVWKGLSEANTKSVQRTLKQLGFYKGAIDGIYGSRTKSAVKSYQAAQLWKAPKADGYWGTATQAHYEWTRQLQATLNRWKGYKIAVDGHYGRTTQRRVADVQRRNLNGAYKRAGGKVVDGFPGPVTCKMLGIPTHP